MTATKTFTTERLTSADTNAQLVNGPACSVVQSAGQSVPTATLTAVTWDTELFDSDAVHSTSVNTSRFTIPAGWGGVWLFVASTAFASNVTGLRQTWFRVNGAGTFGEDIRIPLSGGARTQCVSVAHIKLVAGDYVELVAYQDSGSTINVNTITTNGMNASYVRTAP